MDAKVQSVLDEYHVLIKQQKQIGKEALARDERLLAVGPDTGQLLHVLVRGLNRPNIVEIGTSYGYSGIWLADAARASGGKVTSLELSEHKSRFAREMSEKAGLSDHIDFRVGDALEILATFEDGIDFILLDLWKDKYVACLEVFYPKLNDGAIVVADNMIRPGSEAIAAYAGAVRSKAKMETVLLPVGAGVDVSRFCC